MNPKRQNMLLAIRLGSDLVLVALAWVIAFYFRFYTPVFESPKGVPPTLSYLRLIPFIVAIWFVVPTFLGFYRRSMRQRSAFLEALDIFQVYGAATIAFIAFTYFYNEYRYSRLTLILFTVLHPWMVIAGRSSIRKALRAYRRHAAPRLTLVIAGAQGLEVVKNTLPLLDLAATKLLGVVLMNEPKHASADRQFCEENQWQVFPIPRDWTSFIAEHAIHTVVVAVPHSSYQFLEDHLTTIANQVADVKLIPDIGRYSRFGAGIDLVGGVPILNIHETPLSGLGSLAKRTMDLALTLPGLVLISPLMALLAVLVPLTSRGPILYRQKRMGVDGRPFEIWKFRTMPVDVEHTSGPVFATAHDNRATWLGKVLRKTSLDELPQLFQVIQGHMSLVGPRPERPIFVEQFRRNIPGYMLRHKVKAGLTGWAQVNGWRGDTSIEKRIEFDLYYIRNWTFWLDLRILFMTFAKVLFDKNAY